MRCWPGQPYPLGATWTGLGVNFAIFSAHATRVELCLFDSSDATAPSACVLFPEHTDMVWRRYLPDIRPGQLYGFRVHGPCEPHLGHRVSPNKMELPFSLPTVSCGTAWMRALDTIAPCVDERPYAGVETNPLQGRTLAAFVLRSAPRRRASDASGQPIAPGKPV